MIMWHTCTLRRSCATINSLIHQLFWPEERRVHLIQYAECVTGDFRNSSLHVARTRREGGDEVPIIFIDRRSIDDRYRRERIDSSKKFGSQHWDSRFHLFIVVWLIRLCVLLIFVVVYYKVGTSKNERQICIQDLFLLTAFPYHIRMGLRACPFKKIGIQVSKFPSGRSNRLVNQLGIERLRNFSFATSRCQPRERNLSKFGMPSYHILLALSFWPLILIELYVRQLKQIRMCFKLQTRCTYMPTMMVNKCAMFCMHSFRITVIPNELTLFQN